MADFSHFESLEVSTDKTSEFTLHQITVNGLTPVLVVAPATDANRPYFNALLKRAGKSARTVRAGVVNAGLIEENRDEERELYPKYVVKSWRDVSDADGKVVKFSVLACADFLRALPNWLFDDIRNYCGNPVNFTDVLDVEINSKN